LPRASASLQDVLQVLQTRKVPKAAAQVFLNPRVLLVLLLLAPALVLLLLWRLRPLLLLLLLLPQHTCQSGCNHICHSQWLLSSTAAAFNCAKPAGASSCRIAAAIADGRAPDCIKIQQMTPCGRQLPG
jgi:hypothetical protein